MDLPTRIAIVRRHGLEVSDDGFTPTPDGPVHIDDCPTCRLLTMTPRQRIDAAMDRLAVKLADAFIVRAELERGQTVVRLRKFFGLCQRCGVRKADGSRLMCRECWQDTGPYDQEVTT
jgi:hypothetical protein